MAKLKPIREFRARGITWVERKATTAGHRIREILVGIGCDAGIEDGLSHLIQSIILTFAMEEKLGESNFSDAVAAGRSMTIEQALAFARTP